MDGVLYAYPLTADNGYFLYYNKAYFTEEDVQSLNRMVDVAAEAGRHVVMDWSSAWYVYSFFGNTGLELGLNEDGITNYCNWNSTEGPVRGVDVARAMGAIASSPGFDSRTDEEFLSGVRDGSVIAGVWGTRLPCRRSGGKMPGPPNCRHFPAQAGKCRWLLFPGASSSA